MKKRKSVSLLAAGVLALTAVFGALTYHSVYAQEETPTPTVPAESDTAPDAAPGMFERRGRGMVLGAGKEDLAAALGVTVEELETAQQTALDQALEQAVAEGLLTQEQADQITERGFGRKLFGHWLEGSEVDYDALLAGALDISVQELNEARAAAASAALDRAVEEGLLTQEEADLMKAHHALANDEAFQTNLRSAYEAAVQQAVEDGVITQGQADAILEASDGFGLPGRGGFHLRPGGHGGRFDGDSLAPEGTRFEFRFRELLPDLPLIDF